MQLPCDTYATTCQACSGCLSFSSKLASHSGSAAAHPKVCTLTTTACHACATRNATSATASVQHSHAKSKCHHQKSPRGPVYCVFQIDAVRPTLRPLLPMQRLNAASTARNSRIATPQQQCGGSKAGNKQTTHHSKALITSQLFCCLHVQCSLESRQAAVQQLPFGQLQLCCSSHDRVPCIARHMHRKTAEGRLPITTACCNAPRLAGLLHLYIPHFRHT